MSIHFDYSNSILNQLSTGRLLTMSQFYTKMTRVILWFGAGLFVFIVFAPWQQTAEGQGRVMAFAPGDRRQSITANIEGRIAKWHTREGMEVKEGELLAEIADNDPDIIGRLQSERDAVLQRIKAAEIAIRTATRNIERQKSLVKEGISAERSVELAQVDFARFQSDKASAEAELSRLNVRISRQMMQEVRAPRDGVIQSILVGENSNFIKAGEVIAILVPKTDNRTVELLMHGLDLRFLKIGQKVQLQFEGWPLLLLAGFPELSVGTFRGEVRVIDPSDDGNGYFRVIVAPQDPAMWPPPDVLRQGVKAKGWVLLNRVPVWFEIWRRMSSLPPMPYQLHPDGEKGELHTKGKSEK